MKPKKLKSGKYRLRIYDYQDADGKIHTKTFTAWSRKECIDLANEYKSKSADVIVNEQMLFKDALKLYISGRTNILSPSTIKKYKYMQTKYSLIDDIPIGKIDNNTVQNFINDASKDLSSKSVKDLYGLLRGCIASYTTSNTFRVVLPSLKKQARYLPNSEDILKCIEKADDEQLKLAICLGAYGMMRAGEISAFSKSDLDGNTLHIHQNKVISVDDGYIIKSPKTYESDRKVPLPDFVADMIRNMPEDNIGLNPNNISKKFNRLLETLDIPHFRFHDLRHYCCSTYHDMGISDAIIQKIGGWSSASGNRTMQEVYRHAIESSLARQTANVNEYFENLNKKGIS